MLGRRGGEGEGGKGGEWVQGKKDGEVIPVRWMDIGGFGEDGITRVGHSGGRALRSIHTTTILVSGLRGDEVSNEGGG